MMFEPGAGYEEQNENDDQALLRLRQDEEIQKAFHHRA